MSAPAQASPVTRSAPAAAAWLDLRRLLDAVEAASPEDGVDVLAADLHARVGATGVRLLIADMSGLGLVRLPRRPEPGLGRSTCGTETLVPIAGTAAGLALVTQRMQVNAADGGVLLHAPVSQRGETLGVLEVLLRDPPHAAVLEYVTTACRTLAYVVIADRRLSDLYEVGRRGTSLTIEAEVQRRLLPLAYSCEGGAFALAGCLVPADEAGGDTFDYIVERDTLHLSITDAMGHGLPAAQLATLGVGSLRNSRRQGLDLNEQARRASTHVAQHGAPDQFVTALLGRLDLHGGRLELVNAGHTNPLLVRGGTVREIALEPGLVLGVAPDEHYEVQQVQLRPGDRLVLLTDGMFERDAADAEIVQRLGGLSHLHPRETVQVLTRAVLDVTGGAVRDDATVLVLDWYGDLLPRPADR